MIQTGDPESKRAIAGQALGNGGPDYTIPQNQKDLVFIKKE